MNSLPTEDTSRFNPLIEKFVSIQEKYGDNYPIILYEPSIDCQEKRSLKNLLQGNNSLYLFAEFKEASKFVQSLGISFILIVSQDMDEKTVQKNFGSLGIACSRAMFDFEEEALLKDLFQGIANEKINALKLKAYVFITLLDFMTEAPVKEDEEEVTMMCELKEMAKGLQQEFTVILYDPNLSSESKVNLEEAIEMQIAESNIFGDFAELCQRVKNHTGTPYHLIFSGRQKAEKIIKEIDDLKGLLGLYIYDGNSQEMSDEKVEIKKTLEELIPKIKEGFRTRSKIVNTFPSFATNFDAMDKSHIYNVHYYLKGLINFKNRKQAKEDFIKLARKIYQDQSRLLEKFEATYDTYDGVKMLFWYTKDSPVYKLLNNCLRIASSDSILYSRFVLKDMEEAIREQYKDHCKAFNGLVYRGAYISTEEWEKLERNIGEEIEMYGFLSTTVDQRVAVNFFRGDPKNKIFITIIVPPLPELDEQGFADVSQFSEFKGEKEILFNVRSRFRILEAKISKIESRGTKGRHLVFLYGAHKLRRYITTHRPAITLELKLPPEVKCDMCGFNHKLFGFGQATTEVKCLDCLIKSSIPNDTPLLALDLEKNSRGNEVIVKNFKGKMLAYNKKTDLPFYCSRCFNCQESGKEKYYKWVALKEQKIYEQCSKCFLERKELNAEILLSESDPYVMWQENETRLQAIDSDYQTEFSREFRSKSQGNVYFEVQNYNLSIQYEEKVIKNSLKKRRRETRKLGSFQMLGFGEQFLEKYRKALEYFQRALNIRIAILGEEHPESIALYGNIGSLYSKLKELQKAFDYEQKTLSLNKHFFKGEINTGVAFSYHNLAISYYNLGKYTQALDFCEKGRDIMKILFGENHPDVAKTYDSTAAIYEKLEKHPQAIDYHQKALNIKLAIYGEKHYSTAVSYNHIGSTFQKLGKYQQAIEYYQKALNIDLAIYGEKHSSVAGSYAGIGSVNRELGLYQQAIEYHQKSLDIKKEIFGENHLGTASSYSDLATIYTCLANYKKALEYQQKALSIEEPIQGDHHPSIAVNYNNYAILYGILGEFQKALEFNLKALNIMKAVFGESNSETANSYSSIAFVYQNLGEYRQALEYHQKALWIQNDVFGEKHPKVANSYNNLAVVARNLGDYRQAFEYHQKALDIFKHVFGEIHPTIAESYCMMGLASGEWGKYQKAIEYHKKAQKINKKVFGENHPEVVKSSHNIALVYHSLGKYGKALIHWTKALGVLREVYGDKHPQIVISYNTISMAYSELREFEKALDYLQKALNMAKDIFGENHPNTAASLQNIGAVYIHLDKYKEALEYHEKALRIKQILFEEDHPQIAFSFYNIALIFHCQKDYEKAIEYYKKALDIQILKYEENHPAIADSCSGLSCVYRDLGEYERAFDYCKKALVIYKIAYGQAHPKILDLTNVYIFLAQKCFS